MPIDPEDLYAAAQNLNRMKPPLVSDEVCGRTMVNRMYYAAYLATREAVRRKLQDSSFDASHTTVAETLARAADREVRELGSRLVVLKALREEADYKTQAVITKSDAGLHLMNARFVLDNVDGLAGRFPRMRRR
jgi:hypothetical protein